MLAPALAAGWLLFAPAAVAGTLYQCTGPGGETVYSSSKAGYAHCRAISSYRMPAAAPRAAARRRAALDQVAGSAASSARPPAAPRPPMALTRVAGEAWSNAPYAGTPTPRVAALGRVVASAATGRAGAARGVPGQWSYREAAEAATEPAGGAGDRVLRGAVYRIVRADGSVEYTNLPALAGKGREVTRLFTYIATCVACDLHSTIRWGSVPLNLSAYTDTIRAASIEYGVDEAFLRAIIHAESAFNPRAMSYKGAQGLMQLMPGTASDMGVRDAFDSEQNIRGGARYLGLMLQAFHGDERLAAAAYNAGPGAVRRHAGVPPFDETRVYVERVSTLRKRYGAAIHATPDSRPAPRALP